MEAAESKTLGEIRIIRPEEIERRSMEIIRSELGDRAFSADEEPVVLRVIHTTADFDFADILRFSEGAVRAGIRAICGGADIVTDTNMAKAGIRAKSLERFGGSVRCYMAEEEIAREASRRGVTRACASMEYAAELEKRTGKRAVFAIGNAPTALIRLYELMRDGDIHPLLIIGAPVGFVNVEASKKLCLEAEEAAVPFIIPEGRKGGSTVCAAIVNALLIMAGKETERQDGTTT